MLNFCLLMVPILLLWRQWAIAFRRWSNIIIVYYIWFFIGTNLWSIQDDFIPYIYFQFKSPICYYIYICLLVILAFGSLAIYGITYWNGAHTFWRHYIYNGLLFFNMQAYDYYPSDYRVDFFKKWFKRQKKFRFTKSIMLHHLIFYELFFEFFLFYNNNRSSDWFALSLLLENYFYVWCLPIYGIVLFRSLFMSNFLFGHLYFYANNTFFWGYFWFSLFC